MFLYSFSYGVCFRIFLADEDIAISEGLCKDSEFPPWKFCEASDCFHSFQFIGKGLEADGMS